MILPWYSWISLSFDLITFMLCDFFIPTLTHLSISSGFCNASIQPYFDSSLVFVCLRAFLFRSIIEAAEPFLIISFKVSTRYRRYHFIISKLFLTLIHFCSQYFPKFLYSFWNWQIKMILAQWCSKSDLNLEPDVNNIYLSSSMNNSLIYVSCDCTCYQIYKFSCFKY